MLPLAATRTSIAKTLDDLGAQGGHHAQGRRHVTPPVWTTGPLD
jgi:hypothetical protein